MVVVDYTELGCRVADHTVGCMVVDCTAVYREAGHMVGSVHSPPATSVHHGPSQAAGGLL